LSELICLKLICIDTAKTVTLTAAMVCTLIPTAKLNGVDPQAWLADIPGRITEHKTRKLDELIAWPYVED
jgi:transposase